MDLLKSTVGIHSAKAIMIIAAEKKLGNAATRLAVHMAHQTLDFRGDAGEPENTYWGGRDGLALGLGYLVAEYDRSDDGNRSRNAAHAAVKRALAELIAANVIRRTEVGHGRRRSTYVLLVPSPPSRKAPRTSVVETADFGAWSPYP